MRERPFEFVDAFSRILDPPMRFGRYMEATDWARRIAIEVYVALTDVACKDTALLEHSAKPIRTWASSALSPLAISDTSLT